VWLRLDRGSEASLWSTEGHGSALLDTHRVDDLHTWNTYRLHYACGVDAVRPQDVRNVGQKGDDRNCREMERFDFNKSLNMPRF